MSGPAASWTAAVAAAAALVVGAAGMESRANDGYFGLPEAAGREEVVAHCGACHSVMLVAQQALTRADWADVMAEMVEEQGMEPPGTEDGALILDYLAEHVGRDDRRRSPGEPGAHP